MTFYQGLAAVLLKIWAATLIVHGAFSLFQYGVMWISLATSDDPVQFGYWLGTLIVSSTSIVLGLALWVLAAPLGKRIGGAIPAAAPDFGVTGAQLVAIGAFLIGVFYLLEYLPKAVGATATLLYQNGKLTDAERISGVARSLYIDWANLAANWILSALAAALALRARDMGRLFGWLRQAGLQRSSAE